MATPWEYADTDEAPPIGVTPAEADAWMDEQMERLARLESRVARINAVADLRIARIRDWALIEAKPLAEHATRLRNLLENAALHHPYPAGLKSVSLAWGTVGRAKEPRSIVIRDPAKALDYAKGVNLPVTVALETTDADGELAEALRRIAASWQVDVAESVSRRALQAHLKARLTDDTEWKPDADETGWTYEGGGDKPFLRLNLAAAQPSVSHQTED